MSTPTWKASLLRVTLLEASQSGLYKWWNCVAHLEDGSVTRSFWSEDVHDEEVPELAEASAAQYQAPWTGPLWCVDCHERPEPFMLQDSVWERLALPLGRGFICWGCCERRLGRRLQIEDFAKCPLNASIFHAFQMGQSFSR